MANVRHWEYKVVAVDRSYIGKHTRKGPEFVREGKRLDPEVDWFEAAEIDQVVWAHVAPSEAGSWTTIAKCLAELGIQDWELVGTTPTAVNSNAFNLLLKRPANS